MEIIMKRLLALSLLVLTILCLNSCSKSFNVNVGDEFDINIDGNTPIEYLNTLVVYKVDDTYYVIIKDYSEKIQNIVEFSSDRQCLKDGGITLIKDTDLDKFLNTDFKELTDAIGEPHADIGSGFYTPVYITNDAHLVVVELTNNMVFEFRIFDLLNKSVNGSIS